MLKLAGRTRPITRKTSSPANVTKLASAVRTNASYAVLVWRRIDDPNCMWEFSVVPAPRAERDDTRYLNVLRAYGWRPMFDGPSDDETFMVEHAWDHANPMASLRDRLNDMDMYEPYVLDEALHLYRYVEEPFPTPPRD